MAKSIAAASCEADETLADSIEASDARVRAVRDALLSTNAAQSTTYGTGDDVASPDHIVTLAEGLEMHHHLEVVPPTNDQEPVAPVTPLISAGGGGRSTLKAPRRLITFDPHATGSALRVQRGVPYTTRAGTPHHWKHSCDIYEPPAESFLQDKGWRSTIPVAIHVHGGGWVRGDKNRDFYGAPGVCRAFAEMGFVAVAVNYRLGEFPYFLHDVADAIAWVVDHLPHIVPNTDTRRIVVSGHSAGAHIVSQLLVDPSYFAKAGIPDASRLVGAAILLSGVYTVPNPFGPAVSNWRNTVFRGLYVSNAFARVHADEESASPTLGLGAALAAALSADDSKRSKTKHGPTRNESLNLLADVHDSVVPSENELGGRPCFFSKGVLRNADVLDHKVLPAWAASHASSRHCAAPALLSIPCAVLSAGFDLGLEFDAERLVALLRHGRAWIDTPTGSFADHVACARETVDGTNHGTICHSTAGRHGLARALRQLLTCSGEEGGNR